MTAKLSALLAKDTLKIAKNKGHMLPYYIDEIQEFERRTRAIEYGEEFMTRGYSACLYDAGHIPGSSSVRIEKNNQSLFYTGDINTIATELQSGADTESSESDILITECTYFGKNHTPRNLLEVRFVESVKETIESGGKALIAAFSVGRTQEMMLLLKKHGFQAYVDGMGIDVFDIIKRKPQSVRDMKRLEKAFEGSIVNPEDREALIKEPCVIVTSAGMLNGGPVLYYLREIHDDPKSKLHLTGYQAEDTNGRRALERKYIEDGHDIMRLNCRIEQYDFSAHCGDRELKEVVKRFADNGTEAVFVMHGENAEGFALWVSEELGVGAKAPSMGERLDV